MRDDGDFHEFREAVADLGDGEGPQEGEVEEGVYRGVVGAEAVFVVAVVDCSRSVVVFQVGFEWEALE